MTDMMMYSLHEENIPDNIKDMLPEIYQSSYSTYEYISSSGHQGSISACVQFSGQKVTHVLLFRRSTNTIDVLNEVYLIDDDTLQSCCEYLFRMYPAVVRINFRDIAAYKHRLSFPFYQIKRLDTYVLHLPASIEEYSRRLSKSLMREITRLSNKIRREHSGYAYDFYYGTSITPEQVRTLIHMSRSRISGKGQTFDRNDDFFEATYRMCQKYGVLGVMSVNGEIIAASLCYKVGSAYYYQIVGHDNRYSKYMPGIISTYTMIKHAIGDRSTTFDFNYGAYEYKLRFQTTKEYLSTIAVFRSRYHKLRAYDSLLEKLSNIKIELKKMAVAQAKRFIG